MFTYNIAHSFRSDRSGPGETFTIDAVVDGHVTVQNNRQGGTPSGTQDVGMQYTILTSREAEPTLPTDPSIHTSQPPVAMRPEHQENPQETQK